jgi:hypothetical protein
VTSPWNGQSHRRLKNSYLLPYRMYFLNILMPEVGCYEHNQKYNILTLFGVRHSCQVRKKRDNYPILQRIQNLFDTLYEIDLSAAGFVTYRQWKLKRDLCSGPDDPPSDGLFYDGRSSRVATAVRVCSSSSWVLAEHHLQGLVAQDHGDSPEVTLFMSSQLAAVCRRSCICSQSGPPFLGLIP